MTIATAAERKAQEKLSEYSVDLGGRKEWFKGSRLRVKFNAVKFCSWYNYASYFYVDIGKISNFSSVSLLIIN